MSQGRLADGFASAGHLQGAFNATVRLCLFRLRLICLTCQVTPRGILKALQEGFLWVFWRCQRLFNSGQLLVFCQKESSELHSARSDSDHRHLQSRLGGGGGGQSWKDGVIRERGRMRSLAFTSISTSGDICSLQGSSVCSAESS